MSPHHRKRGANSVEENLSFDNVSRERRALLQFFTFGVFGAGVMQVVDTCCGQERRPARCANLDEFWKQVDEIKARKLVETIVSAGKNQVEYARDMNRAKRAKEIFGEAGGRLSLRQAEMHYRRRTADLKEAKAALRDFYGNLDQPRRQQLDEYLSKVRVKEATASVRPKMQNQLLEAPMKADDTREAVRVVNSTWTELEGIRSGTAAKDALDQDFDELIAQPMSNPSLLCILLLIKSGFFKIMAKIALIIAILAPISFWEAMDELINLIC